MARRKIREYDSKRLIAEHISRFSEIKIPKNFVQATAETDLKKLSADHPWLNGKLVVKPDMLFGQRGKHKLVLLDATLDEAQKFIKEKLGQVVEIKGVKGALTTFIVEPFVSHEDEYYLSILTGRTEDTINFSVSGGMDVEENWGKVLQIPVPIGKSIDEVDIEDAFNGKPERKEKTVEFIRACYKLFVDLDFTLLEMNPFTFDKDGNPVTLDMRGELDDTAAFQNMKKWGDIKFPPPFGRELSKEEKFVKEMDEKTGASLKLTVLNPKARIWTMVAGGGASVIYTDTVADLGVGDELGNYGEYSGNPNEEETYLYAKTILDLATRNPDGKPRALIIGGGIANFTDVAKTFKGIIHALKDYKAKLKEANMRIYVRRGGPNYKTGLKLMKNLGKELGVPIEVHGPEANMTTIVPEAIEYIKV